MSEIWKMGTCECGESIGQVYVGDRLHWTHGEAVTFPVGEEAQQPGGSESATRSHEGGEWPGLATCADCGATLKPTDQDAPHPTLTRTHNPAPSCETGDTP